MRRVVRRTLLFLLVSSLATIAWFVVYGGRFLPPEDPLQKSAAILVLAGARLERALAGLERDGLIVRDAAGVRLP